VVMDDQATLGRRSLLAGSAATLAGCILTSSTASAAEDNEDPRAVELETGEEQIPPLEFYFPNGLLDADGQPLTDESLVAVTAEPTAAFKDARARWTAGGYSEDGVWTEYLDDVDIPLVVIDDQNVEGTVVGLGSMMVHDGTPWDRGNAQFMLNLLDRTIRDTGGTATVLYHEFESIEGPGGKPYANQQYYDLGKFADFREYAKQHGYELITDNLEEEATGKAPIGGRLASDAADDSSEFVAVLVAENPEAVWLNCPPQLSEAELTALSEYVARGGVVILSDCSDIVAEEYDRSNGYADGRVDDPTGGDYKEEETDPSGHLNQIAERLGVGFRFNDGLAYDETHNAGAGSGFRQIPVTTQFNTRQFPDMFADRPGIEPNGEFYHYVGNVDYTVDGDTYDLRLLPDGERDTRFEVRVLGIDTPEDGGGDEVFERPVEWEGLADEPLPVPNIATLQFDTACSLVSADGSRLTDDALVPVYAEPTATSEDVSGDGATQYGETPLPLVATGEQAVGVGSLLVNDGAEPPSRKGSVPTYEFLQNLWDDYTGGGKTVLYDESHAQPVTLADHAGFRDVSTFSEEEKANNQGGQNEADTTDDPTADYEIRASSDLLADLEETDAAAVWLTPPAEPFTEAELAGLREFVRNGGTVFLHGRADGAEAFTANLNEVAAAIDAPFRVNSDRVRDPENGGGSSGSGDPTKPRTSRLGDRNQHPYFLLRQSDAEKDINAGGFAGDYDHPHLEQWGSEATTWARDQLESSAVCFELDPDATIIGGLGRLYGRTYDKDEYPDGEPYAQKALREGYARAYDANHTLHDEFLKTEIGARVNNRGLWGPANPARSAPIRNRAVEEFYLPQAASVRTESGPLGRGRAPILAEGSAEQTGDPSIGYRGASGIPLAGIDREAGTAMIGAPLLAESYEIREDDYRSMSFVTDVDPFRVNVAGYENFVFLTNLINALSEKDDGAVLIDGGHFQFGGGIDRFGGNYTFSAEDARYYERFLEGVGIACEGINDLPANLTGEDLVEARGLIVSTPRTAFDEAELEALRAFRANGGAVVFVGSAEAPAEETRLLNDVAARFGTDLRLNDDQVLDERHNLKGEARLPTTSNLNTAFEAGPDLFSAVEPEPWTGPGNGLGKSSLDEVDDAPPVEVSGSWSCSATRISEGQYVAQAGAPIKVTLTIETLNTTAEVINEINVTEDGAAADQTWRIERDRGDLVAVEDASSGNQNAKRAVLEPVTPDEVAGEGTATRSYFITPTSEIGYGHARFEPGRVRVTGNNQDRFSNTDHNVDVVGAPEGVPAASGSIGR